LQPAGSIKRIATAILIDDAVEYTQENGKNVEKRRKRTEDELSQLEDLSKAAVGFDTTRGDTFVLQSIPFQIVPLEPTKTPGLKDKVDTVFNQWKSPLRYLGLFLMALTVYFLMIRPMQRPRSMQLENEPTRLDTTAEPSEPAVTLSGAPAAATAAVLSANLMKEEDMFMEGELHKELSATSSDVKRAVILKRHLVERVKNEPVVASKLIQNWIRAKGERR
jgi:flagellar M-ring protein FliF